WPMKGIFYEPMIVSPKDELAVPVDVARETGAIYYDTKGLSDWSLGNHPVTGDPFSFDGPAGLLTAVKGIGWDVPQKLFDYMHDGPMGYRNPLWTPEDEKKYQKTKGIEKPEQHGPSTKKGVQAEVDRLLIAGVKVSQIVAETGA